MLSAGEIDPTFGSGGLTTLDLGGESEVVAQILPAPNGKSLIFGRADSGNRLVVARFNSDGMFDGSFAGGGIATTSVVAPAMDDPGSIAVDSSGRFAVIYSDSDSAGAEPAGVAMFTANGAIDTSFSGDGLIQEDST